MSVRIFNKRMTRMLVTEGDHPRTMILKPFAFADVPEEFTQDITFRMGVKAGDIEVFETGKQGEQIEKDAFEGAKPEKKSKPQKTGETE